MSKFLNSILFLGAILAIGLVLSGYKENFELMPTKIPSRVLLADSYPVKGNPRLSNNGNAEQYLLDLEREAFLSLCGERKTLERIEHMLKKGKPLRN